MSLSPLHSSLCMLFIPFCCSEMMTAIDSTSIEHEPVDNAMHILMMRSGLCVMVSQLFRFCCSTAVMLNMTGRPTMRILGYLL